jgi:hypothetical protein
MPTVTFNRDHSWSSRDIIGQATPVDWDALELHQTLSNLCVGVRIDLTTLRITKEVIQSIESTLSVVICRVLTEISAVTNRIVDRTVRLLRLRGVISIMSLMMMCVLRCRAVVHLGRMVIIAIGRSLSSTIAILTSMLFW